MQTEHDRRQKKINDQRTILWVVLALVVLAIIYFAAMALWKGDWGKSTPAPIPTATTQSK